MNAVVLTGQYVFHGKNARPKENGTFAVVVAGQKFPRKKMRDWHCRSCGPDRGSLNMEARGRPWAFIPRSYSLAFVTFSWTGRSWRSIGIACLPRPTAMFWRSASG